VPRQVAVRRYPLGSRLTTRVQTPVPEPATLLITLAAGLPALLKRRHRVAA